MKNCLLCEIAYKGHKSLCSECWTEERQREMIQVTNHNRRAKKYGLPATLTLKEWLATLDHFNWTCAYCLQAPYQAFDHFIPFNTHNTPLNTIRKGTSADNCVPCCRLCNSYKNDKSPEYLLKFYEGRDCKIFPTREMISRIEKYLGLVLLPTPKYQRKKRHKPLTLFTTS